MNAGKLTTDSDISAGNSTEYLSSIPTIVIQPNRGWTSLGLRDVWEYRDLLYLLIRREIHGLFRQTALGISWLFLRPLVSMLILSIVFGSLVKVPSGDLPYPLFSLSALLPWGYFSSAVMRSAGSLVQNIEIISKVYFPRMVITLAGVLSGLVDLGASLVVFLGMLLLYRMPLRMEIIWLPIFTLVAVLYALAVGLWLSTLSVKYRDVAFAVNFLLQALMYLSPVIYPVSLVPEQLRTIYQLNPMTGVIEGYRWALLGTGEFSGVTFLVSIGLVLIALLCGAYIFRRTERTIVDLL